MPTQMRDRKTPALKKAALLAGLTLALAACVSAPVDTAYHTPAPHTARFSYAAPAQEPAPQHPVVFAVGKAAFKHPGTAWLAQPQFANFGTALAEDLAEILEAKGFSLRGPFAAYDLIPYGDKKAIDFYLQPVVTAAIELPNPLYAYSVLASFVTVTVKMDIALREIVTRELMWSKTLTFVELEAPIATLINGYQSQHGSVTHLYWINDVRENLMAQALEKQYPDVMNTLYTLIDAEEMAILQKQAQEIRSKQGS